MGYLYLKDETERLSLLLNEVIKAIEVDESEKASL